MNLMRILATACVAIAVVALGVLLSAQQLAADVRHPQIVAQARRAAEKAREATETAREAAERAKQDAEQAGEEGEKRAGQQETERGDVINLEGDVNIAADNTVKGDVVALGGSAHVCGKVNGNVVAVDGDVHLYKDSNVGGDVIAVGGTVIRESGAEVTGSKVQIAAPWVKPFVKHVQAGRVEAEQEPEPNGRRDVVEYGQSVHIESDQEVKGDLVVFGGSADVDGKVHGEVVVFGGPLDIAGYVRGDAVSIGNNVKLESGAHVRGDAVSIGGRVTKQEGATLEGERVSLGVGGPQFPGPGFGRHGGIAKAMLGRTLVWLVGTMGMLVVTLLVVLVLPRQTQVIAAGIAEAPARALAYGLVGLLLVLPVLVVLCVLVVTLPVVPFYLAAVVVLAAMGGVGVNVLIGRWLARLWHWRVQSVVGIALIGFALLRLVDLIGILPLLGLVTGLVWLAVLVFGFGGALVTRFGTDPTGRWLGGRLAAQPAVPSAGPAQPSA